MKPFAILGATKTGTSTAVAIANAHPSVFCLYECDFTQLGDESRNLDLTTFLPAAKPLFPSDEMFSHGLERLNGELRSKGWNYDWLGTKVQGIRPDLLPKVADMPILFMVRDVGIWATKNRVIGDIFEATPQTNVVPFLISYTSYFLDSFLVERCVRLPFDSVLCPDLSVFPRAVAGLLDLPQKYFENWGVKAAAWTGVAPKNYSNWINGHASAFLPPIFSDTRSTLSQHPFWKTFLPIFNKYFQAANKSYRRDEILTDKKHLEEIGRLHSMTLDEGFDYFESFKVRGITTSARGEITLMVNEKIAKRSKEAPIMTQSDTQISPMPLRS